MKQRFEAWQVNDEQLSFASVESVAEQRAKGLIGHDAKLLYVIEADTWEEACAIHYLRAGVGPYKPEGAPSAVQIAVLGSIPKGVGNVGDAAEFRKPDAQPFIPPDLR